MITQKVKQLPQIVTYRIFRRLVGPLIQRPNSAPGLLLAKVLHVVMLLLSELSQESSTTWFPGLARACEIQKNYYLD